MTDAFTTDLQRLDDELLEVQKAQIIAEAVRLAAEGDGARDRITGLLSELEALAPGSIERFLATVTLARLGLRPSTTAH